MTGSTASVPWYATEEIVTVAGIAAPFRISARAPRRPC